MPELDADADDGNSVSLSTALILVEIFLCVTFLVVTGPGQISMYPRAAILEWAIAFLGAIYLWLFGGFFLDRYLSLVSPILSPLHSHGASANDIELILNYQNRFPEMRCMALILSAGRYSGMIILILIILVIQLSRI